MLELKNITKYYETGDFKQMALNGVSMRFSQNEVVAILGPSGCGKTTLLNIIGGLDRYTEGDLVINGKSTKDFKDSDWDSYRNNSIGFVFQSYNLINHITVLDNVEMALTLSGVSPKEKKERAKYVLERVGLLKHINKKPNQLSGGQKQRVAIARALANDPDIILMDEPTGALDSKTSIQILDLVKEVAGDRLVIMVTHNSELADKYANRVIELSDGEIISDNGNNEEKSEETIYNPKKTAMRFTTALKLSFNNLKTKLVRSIITAFAASIGIIGVALVLSISNGFGSEVDRLQKESLSGMPITISQMAPNFDMESYRDRFEEFTPEEGYIYPRNYMPFKINNITDEYVDFINDMDSKYYESISFEYNPSIFNLIIKKDNVSTVLNTNDVNFTPLPNDYEYILEQFELVDGSMPTSPNQVLFVIGGENEINSSILNGLRIDSTDDKIPFSEVKSLEISATYNNNYYIKNGDYYQVTADLNSAFASGINLEVSGVIRGKTDVASLLISNGLAYNQDLSNLIFEQSRTSDIVLDQLAVDYNVRTGVAFSPINTKTAALKRLGASSIPDSIKIYTSNFDAKDELKLYLDTFNDGKEVENQIIYTDLAAEFTTVISSLINGISIVLIAFAAISLVVSSVMIGIITYVSVLERTKEIGVLRSLGARKKDITRVFNAETFIIGLSAGVFGVVITILINIPLDILLTDLIGNMSNVASLSYQHAIILIFVSVMLTLISGLLPALIAAKKDPVNALREES